MSEVGRFPLEDLQRVRITCRGCRATTEIPVERLTQSRIMNCPGCSKHFCIEHQGADRDDALTALGKAIEALRAEKCPVEIGLLVWQELHP